MLDSGGEGGLGVTIGFQTWKPNPFEEYGDAVAFFIKNEDKTDGYIHKLDSGKSIVFTRED